MCQGFILFLQNEKALAVLYSRKVPKKKLAFLRPVPFYLCLYLHLPGPAPRDPARPVNIGLAG
jgi:hypothetical protein